MEIPPWLDDDDDAYYDDDDNCFRSDINPFAAKVVLGGLAIVGLIFGAIAVIALANIKLSDGKQKNTFETRVVPL